ncbi:uncharacterized protein LOC120105807 [Phoenix dactylifera]|uniref:Uncharacterized protein LOC120105807 n=1 Tax=Phoenix dactylifera TaxID=42345 RepID=A0A8B8ZMC2_PHODC|nr:uncharacterized protein LOC120105807 [Phoenix dactylifera]
MQDNTNNGAFFSFGNDDINLFHRDQGDLYSIVNQSNSLRNSIRASELNASFNEADKRSHSTNVVDHGFHKKVDTEAEILALFKDEDISTIFPDLPDLDDMLQETILSRFHDEAGPEENKQ